MAESNRAEHQHKVEETPSRAILRHNKLSNNCIGKFSNVNVGAGALDSPLFSHVTIYVDFHIV